MSDERKSRYELFLEEEAREALPPKECSRCHKVKALSEYHKHRSSKDGVRDMCKECRNKSRRKFTNRVDRFWKAYHEKTIRVGECIEWQGWYAANRVPCIGWEGRKQPLRRVLYALAIGEIANDQYAATTCRNNRCVRHSHIQLLSYDEWKAYIHADMPVGDHHGSRTHPERIARGDRHGSRTHPDRVPCGERHGSKTHPDRVPHGESNGHSKLRETDIPQIFALRSSGMLIREIASQFGVTENTIGFVLQRKTWKHVQ